MIVYQSGRFKTDPSHSPAPQAPPDNPWWIGKRLDCGICQCVFGVTEASTIRIEWEHGSQGEKGKPVLWVLCPECHIGNRYRQEDVTGDADPFDPVGPPESDESESVEDEP